MAAFQPSSAVSLPVLGVMAKALGQNAGQLDDYCRALDLTTADVLADPRGSVARVAAHMAELESMCGC